MNITKSQKNELAAIAEKHGISHVLLFGSQAAERARVGSDIDIAILAPEKKSKAEYAKLVSDCARIFGVPSGEIDITELCHADPLLLYHAVYNARLLYGDYGAFLRLKSYALKRRMDHRKFFELQERYINQKLYAQP